MPRRLLSAAAACTLLLGLVACGEEEGAVSTPPPVIDIGGPSDGGGDAVASDGGGDEESPSEAPAVAAPNPADYPGMDEQTEEGAQQFTRYFFAMLIWGFQTGEHEQIEELYDPGCTVCESNLQIVRELKQEGEYWSPVEVTDAVLRDLPVANDEFDKAVHYEARVSAHVQPAFGDQAEANMPPTLFKFQAGLDWDGDGWIIKGAALDLEEAE